MTTRKVKKAIKARNENREYTGFMPLKDKQARDKRSRSKNPQSNQITWLSI